ncbi:MAG: UDP-N-acetylmuramoyl-L-alanine--D-glutamate ligase [Bradymonadaceae bacterium]|nr:UDP-N-acetylmuramoyl-L-alanine--D-glutamate ligase [Lujinxingiaceae bacterium]
MRSPLDLKRFAVFGLGRSGVAAANLLAGQEKQVVASDTRPKEALQAELATLDARVEVVYGRNEAANAEVVVLSPGLPPRLPVLAELRSLGIPAISEIELAFFASRAPFVAITGTDGKTTTTQLTGEIFEASGRPTVIAGNIGTPLCEVVEAVPENGIVVAEVSAFQLWSTFRFYPVVAGFTNIAADHLDYFDDFADYVKSKHRLLRNLRNPDDWAVFNYDDPTIRAWAAEFGGKKVGYGSDVSLLTECDIALWTDGSALHARVDGQEITWLARLADAPLKGHHNALNMMCAAGLALSCGVSFETIVGAIERFKPLAHRIEFCAERAGIKFYDDSKATNAHAALAGLRTMPTGFVAIVGGVDKGLDLGELAAYLASHAGGVVVIGEIRERLLKALAGAGMDSSFLGEAITMEEAVTEAFVRAQKGGAAAVILSPACSSFDMFKSYAQRGEVFQAAVLALSGLSAVH